MYTSVQLSRKALLANVDFFKKLAPQSLRLAVLKSNAYGHGLEQMVLMLKGEVEWYGVNSIEEAHSIRVIDQTTPVLIMGATPIDEIKRIPQESAIIPVISSLDEMKQLAQASSKTPFHLKLDTGMSRLGETQEEFIKITEFLQQNTTLNWQGVMTHFANVEDVTDQAYANEQLRKIVNLKERVYHAAGKRKIIFHAAASAAAMLLPESRLDMIRMGISLYGLWPSNETRLSMLVKNGTLPELSPVMQWITKIVHIKDVPAHTSIGYGCTYRVVQNTKLAVIPVGYFEGYERALSNRASVLIQGERARIIGRVCMNMCMVDVTHIPQVQKGDDVILIGKDAEEAIDADELASLTGTINYEVVTRIQKDIPRLIKD